MRDTLRLRAALLLVFAMMASSAYGADEVHWTLLGAASVAFAWRGAETLFAYQVSAPYPQVAFAHTPDPTPDPPGSPHQEVVLTGLVPNTVYGYHIGDGPEHTFRTPPPPGTAASCTRRSLMVSSMSGPIDGIGTRSARPKVAINASDASGPSG